MKQAAFRLIGALGALGMALHGAPALSGRPPTMVSGVTSGIEGRQIVVDGKSYNVQLRGPALRELAQVHAGDKVDLVLNGPPGVASTEVVGIHIHEAR